MRNKINRIKIILECLEQKKNGLNGISRYFTTKNRINTPRKLNLRKFPRKLNLRKFNPFLKRITLHKEL
ncbi:50S ribosomal protein L33 2 [Candidatus Karelsulcia muelleri]|uniref:50S ribosomal protein L33 n=1 Tax=Candidatus Karelsulcia muelleri TaxID=336810 RepID=UPI001FF1AC2A|nr:50S ribosomal protein L33 [Candidatus Karelsulcia muelleri]UOQ38168.1 50S ribosomal protein L33 2 [Candidatus Karelsulcia muelleri]